MSDQQTVQSGTQMGQENGKAEDTAQKKNLQKNENEKSEDKGNVSEQIFRKESLKRISSPEQITDYLQVTNPALWVTLTAVILLLGGILVWSMMGLVETRVKASADADDGYLKVTVKAADSTGITAGMPVVAGGEETEILTVETDEYGRAIATARTTLPDGSYDAEVVTERIHPITFVFPEKQTTNSGTGGQ